MLLEDIPQGLHFRDSVLGGPRVLYSILSKRTLKICNLNCLIGSFSKYQGPQQIFGVFFIVTNSEFIHFRVQCMGPLNTSQVHLNFVSEVLKGSWNVFWDLTHFCASAIPATLIELSPCIMIGPPPLPGGRETEYRSQHEAPNSFSFIHTVSATQCISDNGHVDINDSHFDIHPGENVWGKSAFSVPVLKTNEHWHVR